MTAQAARCRLDPLHLTASWALFPSVAVFTQFSHVWAFLASKRQYWAPLARAPLRLAQHAVVIVPVPAAPKHWPSSGFDDGRRSFGPCSEIDEDCAAIFWPLCWDGDDGEGAETGDREGPVGVEGVAKLDPLTAEAEVELLAALTALASAPRGAGSSAGESLLTTGSEEGPGVRLMELVGATRSELATVLLSATAVATVTAGALDVVVSARAIGILAVGVWCSAGGKKNDERRWIVIVGY